MPSDFDPRLDLPRIVYHDSPESAWRAHWLPVLEANGMTEADLDQGGYGGYAQNGEDAEEASYEQLMDDLRNVGCWGFVDGDSDTVHLWIGQADRAMVIDLIAHELAHLRMESIVRDVADPDQRSEQIATMAGLIAAAAYRIATEPDHA